MADYLPTVTHTGELAICGLTVRCHRLSNGQTVFEAEDFHRLLGALFGEGPAPTESELIELTAFQRGEF